MKSETNPLQAALNSKLQKRANALQERTEPVRIKKPRTSTLQQQYSRKEFWLLLRMLRASPIQQRNGARHTLRNLRGEGKCMQETR